MNNDNVIIKGARVHNLKNVSIEIPKNKLVVFCGISGSGKSSLLFNTIFEEAKTRYLRALLPGMCSKLKYDSPDVDYIEGLLPPIAVEQKTSINLNPRSTVGTSTGIGTLLRTLFSKLGEINGKKDGTLKPSDFSFNASGMCPFCKGLGKTMTFKEDFVIPDKNKSLNELLSTAVRQTFHCLEKQIIALAKHHKFNLNTAFCELNNKIQNIILYGSPEEITVEYISKNNFSKRKQKFPGILPFLERSYEETTSEERAGFLERYMSFSICPECNGKRLNPKALLVTIDQKNIADICSMTTSQILKYYQMLKFRSKKRIVLDRILKEVTTRLQALENAGLGYVTLDRSMCSLSVGESQRVLLASHLGSQLSGLMYILDEPTIGLHEKEKKDLIEMLHKIRKIGNSVLVIEHDEQTLRNADYIIDLGPGAGEYGGKIVACGTAIDLMAHKNSATGSYLRGEVAYSMRKARTPVKDQYIQILKAEENNLKEINVKIPLGLFTCVTGVSGSGKSSLIQGVLYPGILRKLYQRRVVVGKHKDIKGANLVERIINIDQSPIGRTPRSNPASYVGILGFIRDLFAELPLAKKRNCTSGNFSFNTREGQCDECNGLGIIPVAARYLSDMYLKCDKCQGRRFKEKSLEVKYHGKNISDVLNMTFLEASDFFKKQEKITKPIEIIKKVGMGYIRLGQLATTLSAGEAQRIKLASELKRNNNGRNLYILDEPTTGLHGVDVKKLMDILLELVDLGNTVLVIEHNLDVINMADYIIDLGPGSGPDGGKIIAQGPPENIVKCEKSHTGKYLNIYQNKHYN